MRFDNPFTPTFGKIPAILAGRDQVILEMTQAFASSGGDPNLCSLLPSAWAKAPAMRAYTVLALWKPASSMRPCAAK